MDINAITIAIFVITQALTASATVAMLKTDLGWMKARAQDHEQRIRKIERANYAG